MSRSYTLELKEKIVRLHPEEGRTFQSIIAGYGGAQSHHFEMM